ncbi:hypothetical protein C8R45DRAFT_924008 [Mycena sanguinolenta]|nr:hypothetical protein C8R45DRAFT_924008 [Mycena sanguinolenta]
MEMSRCALYGLQCYIQVFSSALAYSVGRYNPIHPLVNTATVSNSRTLMVDEGGTRITRWTVSTGASSILTVNSRPMRELYMPRANARTSHKDSHPFPWSAKYLSIHVHARVGTSGRRFQRPVRRDIVFVQRDIAHVRLRVRWSKNDARWGRCLRLVVFKVLILVIVRVGVCFGAGRGGAGKRVRRDGLTSRRKCRWRGMCNGEGGSRGRDTTIVRRRRGGCRYTLGVRDGVVQNITGARGRRRSGYGGRRARLSSRAKQRGGVEELSSELVDSNDGSEVRILEGTGELESVVVVPGKS